jgi:SpoVT / AbrB like domain.
MSMAEMTVYQDKKNRTYVHLPAFLRDKFDLKKGDIVNVDTDGTRIIITKISVKED